MLMEGECIYVTKVKLNMFDDKLTVTTGVGIREHDHLGIIENKTIQSV